MKSLLGRPVPDQKRSLMTTPTGVSPWALSLAGGKGWAGYIMPQQTGVPFIIRQQVQPSFIMVLMQSQQAWIISAHLGSPEVQVTVQPPEVASQRHMPIIRLQQQTIMPFIIMQQVHMPPWSMVQRF